MPHHFYTIPVLVYLFLVSSGRWHTAFGVLIAIASIDFVLTSIGRYVTYKAGKQTDKTLVELTKKMKDDLAASQAKTIEKKAP